MSFLLMARQLLEKEQRQDNPRNVKLNQSMFRLLELKTRVSLRLRVYLRGKKHLWRTVWAVIDKVKQLQTSTTDAARKVESLWRDELADLKIAAAEDALEWYMDLSADSR